MVEYKYRPTKLNWRQFSYRGIVVDRLTGKDQFYIEGLGQFFRYNEALEAIDNSLESK